LSQISDTSPRQTATTPSRARAGRSARQRRARATARSSNLPNATRVARTSISRTCPGIKRPPSGRAPSFSKRSTRAGSAENGRATKSRRGSSARFRDCLRLRPRLPPDAHRVFTDVEIDLDELIDGHRTLWAVPLRYAKTQRADGASGLARVRSGEEPGRDALINDLIEQVLLVAA